MSFLTISESKITIHFQLKIIIENQQINQTAKSPKRIKNSYLTFDYQKLIFSSILLPENLKHPPSNDDFYPVYYDNTIYDCFNLKVIIL